MRPRQTLAFKLVATGLVFLGVALVSIGITLWVSWQLEGGAAAVNEAGRMRMLTYRLALITASAEPRELAPQVAAMDETLELLRVGDPSRPLFLPGDAASRAELDALRARWSAWRSRLDAGSATLPLIEADAWVHDIEAFVSTIEKRLAASTALLRGVQLAMVALAIVSALLLLYASHLLVLEPLRRLGQGMAELHGGDLAARVPIIASSDEFGELAEGFNAMARRIQSVHTHLEARVREKTARLEVKREQLAALYEVSAFVAQAENLDELARGFVTKIRRIARADAVAVRWSDERNQRYLMLAQEGLPASFAVDEQCVVSGDCHCGQGLATLQSRVIPIRTTGSRLGHCGRAGFDTLTTVPISLHQRALGEIDLFYRSADPLDDEGHSLVETLASHLAGGIEGLRAASAEKEAAVAGERSLLAQELHDSIAQSLAFLKMQVGLLGGALGREDKGAARATLSEIDTGVRECYSDVRELLLHFRTRTAAEDIGVALRTTLSKFEHQSGVPAELLIEGHGVALPPDVQVQVLHIVQEALSNVRKHAHASRVRVRVRQAPEWHFEIQDDGCGFDVRAHSTESQVGLSIMRERAERIGARVDLNSRPGHGTSVALTLPHAVAPPRTNDEPADSIAGR
jgi:two-component system nitrate/nitrite sensor histidine kinase NarX